jgi:ATP-dependent exoDNAse (exonuclease V) beta subunit
MEDFKLILYVLAAVAYFIFMQWRKAFKAPKDDADVEPSKQERRPPAPARPVTSFEDILRELQPKMEQAEAREKTVLGKTKELPKPLAIPTAPVPEKTPKYRNYEDVAPKALSWEKPAEARQMARQVEERHRKLQVLETSAKAVKKNRYAELLRNPASVRDAIILTEIFNRKFS